MAPNKNQNPKAQAAPSSKYAGVSAARAQRPANYFKSGVHALYRVTKVEEGEDKAKTGLVAIQGTIIALFPDSNPNGNQVGEDTQEVIKRTNVAFMGRLKAFAMAVGNLTEANFAEQEYDGQIFDELVGEDQPAAGVIVEVRSSQVIKQTAAGKPLDKLEAKDTYTRVDFVRRLPFSQVQEFLAGQGLDAKVIEQRVPGIAEEIAAEEAEAASEQSEG